MSDTTITTGKVRLSYVHVFEPYSNNGGTPKYSLCAIVPKSDTKTLAKIEAAIKAATLRGKSERWNGKIPTNLKTPLHDGDMDRPDDPACANSYYFNCSSKKRPGVVDRDVNAILDPEEVYSGCYGRVSVNFYPYDNSGNRGIGVGLNHVQKLSDGTPLGGGSVSVETAFADAVDDDLFD